MAHTAGDDNVHSGGSFSRFEVVSDNPTYNHFFDGARPPTKEAYKTIMREWRLLEESLPDTIFVRAYEKHVMLLRAAIVGAWGTPYHNFLFFFDICLPSYYPAAPPEVYFRSLGFGINPNMDNNGFVCLSLLNTTSGEACEMWNPKHSTLLQVLLSLQALVLNEKPYFNETYPLDIWGEGMKERWAAEYNDEVFLLCCRLSVCLLKDPPEGFEALVAAHFHNHGVDILNACNERRRRLATRGGGLLLGAIARAELALLERVYRELVAALARSGAPVEYFVEKLAAEKEARERAKAIAAMKKEEMKRKIGEAIKNGIMEVVGFFEKILVGVGLNKCIGLGNED